MSYFGKTKTISELTLTQTNPVSEKDFVWLEVLRYKQFIQAPLSRKIIVGRRDPASTILPDVDLTPFEAYSNGVSRSHAQLRCNSEGYIEVSDLGSSNGTYVNKRRLRPHIAQVVHNGDRVQLGNIEMVVRYPEGASRM